MKNISFAAAILLFGYASLLAQANKPASVFKPALDEIRGMTRIPILLPTKLPSIISVTEIKLAYGEVREDGYYISLYYEKIGSGASYAAGFSGTVPKFQLTELGNTQSVRFSRGRKALFRPVSCGGSCAPANLWWEQNGAIYNVQIKLSSDTPEKDQQKVLIETANTIITVR